MSEIQDSESSRQSDDPVQELAALNKILEALKLFDDEIKIRILRTVSTFLDIEISEAPNFKYSSSTPVTTHASETITHGRTNSSGSRIPFSSSPEVTPKEFLREKQPTSLNYS